MVLESDLQFSSYFCIGKKLQKFTIFGGFQETPRLESAVRHPARHAVEDPP